MTERAVTMDDLTSGLREVFDYWTRVKGSAIAPRWRDIDLTEIPSRLVPTTMVIDIGEPLSTSTYRYWGSVLTDLHGSDMTGKRPYDLEPAEFASQLAVDHQALVDSKRPSAGINTFDTKDGLRKTHMVVRLPLCDDSVNVSHIMIVADNSPEAMALIGPLL